MIDQREDNIPLPENDISDFRVGDTAHQAYLGLKVIGLLGEDRYRVHIVDQQSVSAETRVMTAAEIHAWKPEEINSPRPSGEGAGGEGNSWFNMNRRPARPSGDDIHKAMLQARIDGLQNQNRALQERLDRVTAARDHIERLYFKSRLAPAPGKAHTEIYDFTKQGALERYNETLTAIAANNWTIHHEGPLSDGLYYKLTWIEPAVLSQPLDQSGSETLTTPPTVNRLSVDAHPDPSTRPTTIDPVGAQHVAPDSSETKLILDIIDLPAIDPFAVHRQHLAELKAAALQPVIDALHRRQSFTPQPLRRPA